MFAATHRQKTGGQGRDFKAIKVGSREEEACPAQQEGGGKAPRKRVVETPKMRSKYMYNFLNNKSTESFEDSGVPDPFGDGEIGLVEMNFMFFLSHLTSVHLGEELSMRKEILKKMLELEAWDYELMSLSLGVLLESLSTFVFQISVWFHDNSPSFATLRVSRRSLFQPKEGLRSS